MIPSKLTIGVMNDLETKPLDYKEIGRLRWERLMEQKDKLPECRSRGDVMRLIGLDPTDAGQQSRGASWIGNLIERGALEEIRTPNSTRNSTFRIIGVPSSVSGRMKRTKKSKKPVVEKVAEKVIEKPVEKIVEKVVEKPAEQKGVHLTLKRGRKVANIDLDFTGVDEGVIAKTLEALVAKIK